MRTESRVGGANTQVVLFGDGDVEPAFGIFQGKDSILNTIELSAPDGTVTVPASKDIIKDVAAGTVYVQIAGGGGGYGDPRERSVETVRDEVRNEIISVAGARSLYGVALDPSTFDIDLQETARLRGGAA